MKNVRPITKALLVLSLLMIVGSASEAKKAPPSQVFETTKSINEPSVSSPPSSKFVAGEHINWQVISSGGSRVVSTHHKLSSTIGQTACGCGVGASFRLSAGFWQDFGGGGGGCCLATVGNVDCSEGDGVDIGDLSALIDNLFINFTPLCCEDEANCDGSGGIDIGDLSALIDNLFINFTPLPACP